jgi:hypothetical protein
MINPVFYIVNRVFSYPGVLDNSPAALIRYAILPEINNLALKGKVCCSRKVVTLRGLIPF